MAISERLKIGTPTQEALLREADNLANNPPTVIMIPTSYFGEGHKKMHEGWSRMLVRCAIGSYIYHSTLYPEEEKPHFASYGRPPKRERPANYEQVSKFLKETFGVDPDFIYGFPKSKGVGEEVRSLYQLTRDLSARGINSPVAIPAADFEVRRIAQEWLNLLRDNHLTAPENRIYFVTPKSLVSAKLRISSACPKAVHDSMVHYIELGAGRRLAGGLREDAEFILSMSPKPVRDFTVGRFGTKYP